MVDERGIRQRYEAQAFLLNERTRRLFAAAEAEAAGRGGLAAVSRATAIARSTIGRGLAELRAVLRGRPGITASMRMTAG